MISLPVLSVLKCLASCPGVRLFFPADGSDPVESVISARLQMESDRTVAKEELEARTYTHV
jgi:hypothetical protein